MPLIFYGAGIQLENEYELYVENGIVPICVADGNPNKWGTYVHGNRIVSLEEAVKKYADAKILITTDTLNWESVTKFLVTEKNIDKSLIINENVKTAKFCNRVCKINSDTLTCCAFDKEIFSSTFSDYTIAKSVMTLKTIHEMLCDYHENDTKEKHCSQCPFYKKQIYLGNRKFSVIDLAADAPCQCKCTYCYKQKADYVAQHKFPNFQGIFDCLLENDLLNRNCLTISIATGEFSISPKIDEIISFLRYCSSKYKYLNVQAISNCIKFCEKMISFISKPNSLINCSLDAGTQETYLKVKGIDSFDQVIQTLTKYKEAGVNIQLKYIILPNVNDNQNDLQNFALICEKLQPISVLVSKDPFSEYEKEKYEYALDFLLHNVPNAKIHFAF